MFCYNTFSTYYWILGTCKGFPRSLVAFSFKFYILLFLAPFSFRAFSSDSLAFLFMPICYFKIFAFRKNVRYDFFILVWANCPMGEYKHRIFSISILTRWLKPRRLYFSKNIPSVFRPTKIGILTVFPRASSV